MSDDGKPKPEEMDQAHKLEHARKLLERGDLDEAWPLARESWLACPDDAAALGLCGEIAQRRGDRQLARALERLASKPVLQNEPSLLFEAGYRLIDHREPAMAFPLLCRCAELLPDHPDCRYELGFAAMQTRRFREAIPHFEFLAKSEDAFDTRLNLAVCYSMARDLQSAGKMVSAMEQGKLSDDQKKEVAQRRWVLKRLERLQSQQRLGVRDWIFALYGAVVLAESCPKDTAKEPEAVAADYAAVATTLLILRGLLTELDVQLDVIEYYSPLSRPLAEAFARLCDVAAESYGGPARSERTLLVMAWGADIVGPHKAFIDNPPNRAIFAYGLPALMPLPVVPDIIGTLAGACTMPWSRQLEDAGYADTGVHPMNQVQARAVDLILDRIFDLESLPEIIDRVEELARYYRSKQDMLALRNSEVFPERAEYTAEIPIE